MGTVFTFCLALNVGVQKKTVPIFFSSDRRRQIPCFAGIAKRNEDVTDGSVDVSVNFSGVVRRKNIYI